MEEEVIITMINRNPEPINNTDLAKEVILYILNRCPDITKEMLCNMLYFIDMDYFEKNEKHLMGLEYIK